jgi:hypothetical protein
VDGLVTDPATGDKGDVDAAAPVFTEYYGRPVT